MKKLILSVLVVLILLVPAVSVDAKSKSSTSGGSYNSSSKSYNNNSNTVSPNTNSSYSNNGYRRHYSRNTYNSISFPWIWFLLMDNDEESIQAYCVPLADTDGDNYIDESEVTIEYEECVKQYSSFSFFGFFISIMIFFLIIRFILNIFKRRR